MSAALSALLHVDAVQIVTSVLLYGTAANANVLGLAPAFD